jgi:hypothetical protein
MMSKDSIYTKIETAWTNTTLFIIAAVVLFGVVRFCYFGLGDLALHLGVFNEPWKQEISRYCVQQIPGCLQVSFDERPQNTQTSRSTWYPTLARQDVSVTAKAGAEQSVRQALVQHVGPWMADHMEVYVAALGRGEAK